MIGDGMGKNHILAGELYKSEPLNIQKIPNRYEVITCSKEKVTDSAAAATALATGYKTNNGYLGIDESGKSVENLNEFFKKQGYKTGIVCTQILNHATPAGFTVHNNSRENYDEIAISQLTSNVDLMFGGGARYFDKLTEDMKKNNYSYLKNFSDVKKESKNKKIIGAFSQGRITDMDEDERISLADMTKTAIDFLENENGFFVMIEGSDIDSYSHERNIRKMINELIDFDNAVKVAMDYVDENPNTLLIVTADHETGGLELDESSTRKQLSNSLFTNYDGEKCNHTDANVLLYTYGKYADEIASNDEIIDNTEICKFIKSKLSQK